MENEDFYEAAIRHWIDGCILEEQGEHDNAVCMQGFAAECALKKIVGNVWSVDAMKKYGHFGESLFQDMQMMLLGDIGLMAMLDPACGLRLSQILLPQVLFRAHPERRYFGDGVYSENDAEECRCAAESFIREMLLMRLDGYI